MFKFSEKSEKRMLGVHNDLVKVVRRALEISSIDFAVLEGVRTLERQKQLLKAGASTTLRSRHLTGHAIDLGAIVDGQVRWDWALYKTIALAVKAAAKELNIAVEWGGDWKSFKDGAHFQLSWSRYQK